MSEQAYIQLLDDLYNNGMTQDNRTGVDAIRKVFNFTEYDTKNGTVFNLFQHKQLPPKSIIGELVCFAQGKTSAADFRAQGCNVWNANANEHGAKPNQWLSNPTRKGEDDLGPIYGKQWRIWEDTKIVCVGLVGPDYNPKAEQAETADYVSDVECENEANIFKRLRFMKKLGYVKVASFVGPYGEINYVLHRKIDQLAKVIDDIKKSPTSRRMIISAWNPADMEFMALPPCHVLQHYLCTRLTNAERLEALKARKMKDYLWHHTLDLESESTDVSEAYTAAEEEYYEIRNVMQMSDDGLDMWNAPQYRLDLVMFQRSADTILGSPFNVASYDTMINVMAQITNTAPGSLMYLTSDTHIYIAHEEATKEILTERSELPAAKPMLLVNPALTSLEALDAATVEDFRVTNYENMGKLRSPTPMMV